MTPHHLAARAAAWSLQAARTTLTARAETERRVIVAELLEPPSVLRSPIWGRRGALGGHSDPTTTALLDADRPARRNRYAELAADITTRLALPGGHLPGDGDPLDRIIAAIPGMLPGTAAATTKLLVRLDERVRRELRIGAARRPLPGVECRACRHRLCYEQTAGPAEVWTVVCAADCRCIGAGCRCGMAGAVEGAPHIWPRSSVIGAVAGAAPTNPTN